MEAINTILVHFGGSSVHGNINFFSRLKASRFDGLQYRFNSLFVRTDVRCKPTFITHIGRISFFLQDRFKVMEYFHSHPKRFAESISAYRHDHKFLKIDFVIGMRATVEDIQQWNRKGIGIQASTIPVTRLMRKEEQTSEIQSSMR